LTIALGTATECLLSNAAGQSTTAFADFMTTGCGWVALRMDSWLTAMTHGSMMFALLRSFPQRIAAPGPAPPAANPAR
jgi:hypothetical protein